MLDQVIKIFNIIPDYDLNVMVNDQTLAELSVKIMMGINKVISMEMADLIIVQADTTNTFITSLIAYYNKIQIAHMESGFRDI